MQNEEELMQEIERLNDVGLSENLIRITQRILELGYKIEALQEEKQYLLDTLKDAVDLLRDNICFESKKAEDFMIKAQNIIDLIE